ncbi:f-box domain-containing protein [Gigaspora margarita]|uniref:F-box domain-containing protein n=1 Tax=Gigaspora margarita TaxID=4874 RepID=A0A8H4EWE9_GIGMA|nr:f-box domain-containing protein [Gigaspora margarita]
MIALPNECYYQIFNNLRCNDDYYRDLFSCILVNRHWCRVAIPILWSEPEQHFKDEIIIRTFLLTLNTEEQALLIPFKNILPNGQKPLFEYTSYITSIPGT